MRQRSAWWFLPVVGPVLLGGCGSTHDGAEIVAESQDPLFLAPGVTPWSANNYIVPSCYLGSPGPESDPPARGWSREKELVANALNNTWGAESRLKFTFTDACPLTGSQNYVRLKIYGSLNEGNGGQARAPWGGTASLRPPSTTDATTPGAESVHFIFSSTANPTSQGRVEYLAVHEFGHVLGFHHEQYRPEQEARECDPTNIFSGTVLSPYDRNSIMNYCQANGNGSGAITGYDRMGVRRLYGFNPSGSRDFTGDGKSDLIWVNNTSGEIYLWPMDGATHLPSGDAFLGTIPSPWLLSGSGDFTRDGQLDLIWYNTSGGEIYIWHMDGTAHVGDSLVGNLPGAEGWRLQAVADFNGDNNPDLVWRNTVTQAVWIWTMDGVTHVGDVFVGNVDTQYELGGAADFTGDGQPDLIWHSQSTGQIWIWPMNGTTHVGDVSLGSLPGPWKIGAVADYNGDRNTDVVWYNTSTGATWLWPMSGTTHLGGGDTLIGTVPGWSVAAP